MVCGLPDGQLRQFQDKMRIIQAFLTWSQAQSVSMVQSFVSPTDQPVADLFLGANSPFTQLRRIFNNINTLDDLNHGLCAYTRLLNKCKRRMLETDPMVARRRDTQMISATLRSFLNAARDFNRLVAHAQACISRQSEEAQRAPCKYIRDSLRYYEPLAQEVIPDYLSQYRACMAQYNELVENPVYPGPNKLTASLQACQPILSTMIERVGVAIDGFDDAANLLLTQYPCVSVDVPDLSGVCSPEDVRAQEALLGRVGRAVAEQGDTQVVTSLQAVSQAADQWDESAVNQVAELLAEQYTAGETNTPVDQQVGRFLNLNQAVQQNLAYMRNAIDEAEQKTDEKTRENALIQRTLSTTRANLARVEQERNQALIQLEQLTKRQAEQAGENAGLSSQIQALTAEKQQLLARLESSSQQALSEVDNAQQQQRNIELELNRVNTQLQELRGQYRGAYGLLLNRFRGLRRTNDQQARDLIQLQQRLSQESEAKEKQDAAVGGQVVNWRQKYMSMVKIVLVGLAIYIAYAALSDNPTLDEPDYLA